MKLFVILPRLDGGGMERVSLNLLPEFHAVGIEVFLVVGQLRGELVDLIPADITVLEVAPRGPHQFLSGLLCALRIYQPSHILSAADDVNCLTLLVTQLTRSRAKVVVSNHNTLSQQIRRAHGLKRLKLFAIRAAMRRLYPLADGIVAVSHGVADDLVPQLRLARKRINVIYNPVITADFAQRMNAPAPDFWTDFGVPLLLYAGRLTPEKRLDLLFDAFGRVLDHHEAHLAIAGIGPMRDWIEEQIRKRRWHKRVTLCGFIPNILPLMRKADVLVLPSDHEGLPTVLIEALACGTQIVATDCPSGPAEILEGGKWGLLTPTNDARALSHALLDVIEGRFKVPVEQLQISAARFSASIAAQHYLSLLTTSHIES